MAEVRKDTVTLETERDAVRIPGAADIAKLMKQYGVEVGDMRSVEREYGSRRIFVKVKNGDVLEKVATGEVDLDLGDNVKVKVTVSTSAFGVRMIRVRNLPTEVPMDELRKVLSEYGTVMEMRMEQYGEKSVLAGLLTGVRIAKVELTKHVPNFIKVGGCEAYTEYSRQPRTCMICNLPGHLRVDCAQRGSYAYRLRKPRGATATPRPEDGGKFVFDNKRADDGRQEGANGGSETKVSEAEAKVSEAEAKEAMTTESEDELLSEETASMEEPQEGANRPPIPIDPEKFNATLRDLENKMSKSFDWAQEAEVVVQGPPKSCVFDASTLSEDYVYQPPPPPADAEVEGQGPRRSKPRSAKGTQVPSNANAIKNPSNNPKNTGKATKGVKNDTGSTPPVKRSAGSPLCGDEKKAAPE